MTRYVDSAGAVHLLVVDDEVDLCELIAMRLEHHGYRVSYDHTLAAAVDRLARETIDAIVLDLRLEDDDGLELLDHLKQSGADIPVVVLTAHGSIEAAVEAMQRGAYGFLTKPFHDHELLQKMAHAVEDARLRRELAGLRRMIGASSTESRLLGTSPAIGQVRELIARVAPSDATVLVIGESGTGKELAARTLHAMSERAARPFVAINCGALPAELLESELFGHVRGAFTGAHQAKQGLFAAADGGTLFLDEVGDAPAAVQVKLLRVLQERRYTPVGSTREESVDVRVVAATHRDLLREVEAGRFREDLFYRLHVFPLRMPPLRERREDLPLLAERFLGHSAPPHWTKRPRFESEAMRLLVQHDWPGNVRELANVIQGAALLSPDGEILADHMRAVMPTLRAEAGGATVEAGDPLDRATASLLDDDAPFVPMREAREAFDRAYLQEALRRAAGNVSAAARLAGRNRTDFHDLLRRYEIDPGAYRES